VKRAFSLTELLVVIAIIAALTVIAIPLVSTMGRSTSLSGAVQSVTGYLDLARQTALTQNRTVEVRFYKLPPEAKPDSAPADYRALQIFLVDYDTASALNNTLNLSAPAIIAESAAASSLMDDEVLPEQEAPEGVLVPPGGENYRYRSFRFKPDGTTDLPLNGNWFLTLVNRGDPIAANNLPANHARIHIEPLTGKLKVERPE
jgi:uncharacterized protein (TIGR02596 family)